ncbi:hypothetical protein PO124_04830 [Bacillus licheniformis]|nr:hypothetical protein [Bacillus licheniformis]
MMNPLLRWMYLLRKRYLISCKADAGQTVIIVSHRLSTARLPTTSSFRKGRVAEAGTHQELMKIRHSTQSFIACKLKIRAIKEKAMSNIEELRLFERRY